MDAHGLPPQDLGERFGRLDRRAACARLRRSRKYSVQTRARSAHTPGFACCTALFRSAMRSGGLRRRADVKVQSVTSIPSSPKRRAMGSSACGSQARPPEWREDRREPRQLGLAEIVVGEAVQRRMTVPGQEARHGADVLGVVVESGDDRHARLEPHAAASEASEVLEDRLVARAREPLVRGAVHVLQVELDEIEVGEERLHPRPREHAAGLHGDVESLGREEREQALQEGRLHHRLAAGERHAAPRVAEEVAILQDLARERRDVEASADQSERVVAARLDAASAGVATSRSRCAGAGRRGWPLADTPRRTATRSAQRSR